MKVSYWVAGTKEWICCQDILLQISDQVRMDLRFCRECHLKGFYFPFKNDRWRHVTSLLSLAIPAMAPQRTPRFRPLLVDGFFRWLEHRQTRETSRSPIARGFSCTCTFCLTSDVAHSCLCMEREETSCWLWLIVCLWPLARLPSWLVTLRGDIRFKNVGLPRTGIHKKPSNRAPISRFSSHLIGNL